MGRGSIGDIVMTRRNGQQQARVRVRHVNQRKTLALRIEQAALATSSQAYKAMKKIVSKSWEGVKAGTPSQSEFSSRTISMIRNGLTDGTTRVVPYKASAPVANLYPLSNGSLPTIFDMYGRLLMAPLPGESLKEWCKRIDLKRSDVFAICMINAAPTYVDEAVLASFGDSPLAKHMMTRFGYYQFKISASAINSDQLCEDTTFVDIWDVSHTDVRILMTGWGLPFNFDAINLAYNGSMRVLCAGVVRMRSTGRLRGSAQMVKIGSEEFSGIGYDYIEAAWNSAGTNLDAGSDNVLDGSGFNDDGTNSGGGKPKKLNQLLAKYWQENAAFYYVLMGEFRGVINPVIKATYTETVSNKLHFDLQCVSQDGKLMTADEYGVITLVTVADLITVGHAVAGDAAYIANNAQNSGYYAGWHTQYKKSGVYNYEDSLIGNSVTVSYRSYNKA